MARRKLPLRTLVTRSRAAELRHVDADLEKAWSRMGDSSAGLAWQDKTPGRQTAIEVALLKVLFQPPVRKSP
jgi:hypothetical protein